MTASATALIADDEPNLAAEDFDRVGPLSQLQIDGLEVDQQLDLILQSFSSRTGKKMGPPGLEPGTNRL